ncbi:hypothetical protein TNCT_331061 [Trichonephila clavata]|uniref:Uncharacterized protein n=1 Tax=Trichonephila clavata TaxID=2740835 RepID=A0A8X6KF50_TRICU|nr:hypothetical protein TNCT_331061 [Trichonephila clavata]
MQVIISTRAPIIVYSCALRKTENRLRRRYRPAHAQIKLQRHICPEQLRSRTSSQRNPSEKNVFLQVFGFFLSVVFDINNLQL